jgi:hypothetical protein
MVLRRTVLTAPWRPPGLNTSRYSLWQVAGLGLAMPALQDVQAPAVCVKAKVYALGAAGGGASGKEAQPGACQGCELWGGQGLACGVVVSR